MYEGKNLSLQMIVWKGRGLIGKFTEEKSILIFEV